MSRIKDGWLMRWNRINVSDITSLDGWSDDEISFVTLSTGEKIMSFGADRGDGSGYCTFFVKFTPQGEEISKMWINGGNGAVWIMQVDHADNIYCITRISGTNVIFKMNSSMEILWQKTFSFSSTGRGNDIFFDNNNDPYLSIRGYRRGGGAKIVKLDRDTGALVSGMDVGFGGILMLQFDSDNNIWVNGWLDSYLWKLDQSYTVLESWDHELWNPYGSVWYTNRYSMTQIVNDEVYVNNYSNMCKYDIDMNKLWQNGLFVKYDDIIPAGEAYYDAWVDSGPIKTDAQGNTYKINSRQYNASDNDIDNKSGVSLIKYDTDGTILWAYFLNQNYPTAEEITANYDYLGNVYYNVWVDLGAGGIQVGPGTVDFTFISYNDMGNDLPRYTYIGSDTGFFVSLNEDGLTSGTVTIPLPLELEYHQESSWTLYDNMADLRDDSYGFTERFTSVAHPTFSAHGVTMGDTTLLTASVPEFTYEAMGIDWFYRDTGIASAGNPNMQVGFL